MSFHTHKKTNKQTQSYLYFFVYFVKQNFPLSKEEMTIDQKKREREKKKRKGNGHNECSLEDSNALLHDIPSEHSIW